MTNPRIRNVVLGMLVLGIVSQVGIAAILSNTTNTPTGDQPTFGNDRLEAGPAQSSSLTTQMSAHAWTTKTLTPLTVESLEQAFVAVIQNIDTPGLLVLAGTTRNGDGNPLDNEVRTAIYESVSESSGIRLTSLAEELEVPTSTVRYHVRVLDDTGMVDVETIWGKRWLSVPTTDRTDILLTAALDDEVLSSVFEVLHDDEPASVSELAAALDRAPSTVTYHLQRLANEGLVKRVRDGSSVRTSLAEEIKEQLDEEL